MDEFEELKAKYESLRSEFETYQSFAEGTIQQMSNKNNILEKKIDALFSIVEISKYINSKVRDENFIAMINDMIIGILGVNYSSIYLKNDIKFEVKATNIPNQESMLLSKRYWQMLDEEEPFIINSKETLTFGRNEDLDIHSIIGVPIFIREKYTGYIIVEHILYDFFNFDHIKFISSIANQIGVALENNLLYNQLKESSSRDPLIGIYNRRHFFNVVEEKIKKNPSVKFAVVMMDLDNFKKINDMYGHQFGDEALIETSRIISENIGENDIVARYGGEEIVIYIEDAICKEEVVKKVETIRAKLSDNTVHSGGYHKNVTASFGISYYPYDSAKLQEVLSIADVMMYNAKKGGKNRVEST